MKLEELIKNESEIAYFAKKMMKNKGKDCHDSITWKNEFEYHKQLAEWLEELKDLREMKETIECNAEVLKRQVYNNAIDEFQEWIKSAKIVGVDNVTNDILVPVKGIWEYAVDVFKEEKKIK